MTHPTPLASTILDRQVSEVIARRLPRRRTYAGGFDRPAEVFDGGRTMECASTSVDSKWFGVNGNGNSVAGAIPFG
jgi:hypothetical protein